MLGGILTNMAVHADDLLNEIEMDCNSFTCMEKKANGNVQISIPEKDAVKNLSRGDVNDERYILW